MNRRVTTALVLALLAASSAAIAQNPAPNPGAGAAVVAPPQEQARPPAQPNRSAAADADARRCLDFPDNSEVIKCAERYLPRRRNG